MRWFFLLMPLFLINSGCIFVEGSVIEEPKDVVIPPCVYKYTAYSPCQRINVSEAKRTFPCNQIK